MFNGYLEITKGNVQSLLKKKLEKNQATEAISGEKEKLLLDLEKERKLRAQSEQKVADLQGKLETSLVEKEKIKKKERRRYDLLLLDLEEERRHNEKLKEQSEQKVVDLQSKLEACLVELKISQEFVESMSAGLGTNEDTHVDLSRFVEQLKIEGESQRLKIVKLTVDQMKACRIIKSMTDSKNKTDEVIGELKKRNKELEKELEEVVTKLEEAF